MQGPADTLLARALTARQQGHPVQSEICCRQILVHHPQHIGAMVLLAQTLLAGLRACAALGLVRQLVMLQPSEAAHHALMAQVFEGLDSPQDAVAAWSQACRLSGSDPAWHCRLAAVLLKLGRDDEALQALSAVEHRLHPSAIRLQARLLHRLAHTATLRRLLSDVAFAVGQTSDARPVYQLWCELLPDDSAPRHRLVAGSDQSVPARASDGYVTQLFDRYADTFDQKLAALDYRAPQLMAAHLGACVDLPTGQWQVLDAGCGTGLCAPWVRQCARHLTGVDLSGAMVAKARQRGVYDTLVVAEITAYLNACPDACELIASGDTLIYFGDLLPVLVCMAKALRPSGYAVFSLEQALDDIAPTGYRLNASGRYSHSAQHVRHAVAQAGLHLRTLVTETVRTNAGKPVAGLIVVVQRPALVADSLTQSSPVQ